MATKKIKNKKKYVKIKYLQFKKFLTCKYFIFTYLLLFIFLVAMLAGGEYYTEYGAIVPPHLQG